MLDFVSPVQLYFEQKWQNETLKVYDVICAGKKTFTNAKYQYAKTFRKLAQTRFQHTTVANSPPLPNI